MEGGSKLAINITAGGEDYTEYVDLSSIQIDSNLAVNSDTAQMNIRISNQNVPYPKGGQEIIIMNGDNIEFAGVILKPAEDMLSPDTMIYATQCRDYLYWFNKYLVVESYTNMTAGDIVKAIVSTYAPEFTVNNVMGTDGSFTISTIKFDHIYPSDAIQQLADAVGFTWWVDYKKDVHFVELNSFVSPLPDNILDADNDTQNYGDLHLEEDVSQVRNQIYLTGYKVAAMYTITDKFVADGQQTSFTLNYEPQHVFSGIAVKQNSTVYPTKLDLTDGNATSTVNDGYAYIDTSNKTVRFNVAPAQGVVVSITYRPRYDTINMYNDPNSMDIMRERDGLDGVYESTLRDQQLSGDDTSLANTRGNIELAKYAYPHYSGTFYSFLQGWRPGQYFLLTSNRRMDGIFQRMPFYITKTTKTVMNHPKDKMPTFRYDISIADSMYVY